MGIFGLVTRKEAQLQARIAVLENSQVRSSTLQNPSQELLFALEQVGLIGTTNESGVRVDDRNTLGLTAFARGLNLIGDGIASMPLKRYSKRGEVRSEVPDSLIARPNPWQTQYQWVKYMATMQAARGNAYSWIVRNGTYKPTMTIPIHPRHVKPVVVDGDLFYKVQAPNFPTVIHHTDMIHWKGLCYENLVEGISPIEYHAQTLGISLSAEKGTARNNKTNAKKILIKGEAGKQLQAPQRESLKQDLQDVYNGDSMALVLPNGLELDYLTMSPAEAEFLTQRQYGAVEIARILNIPSSLLDADNGGNKSSVEQESINFHTFTLHPKTTDFVQELTYKLISNENEYYKFNFNSLLRADANARAEFYIKAKKFGMSDNEIRAYEDMNGYEGGDRRYADLNQIPKDIEDEYYAAKIENMLKSNMTNNATGNNNNTQS